MNAAETKEKLSKRRFFIDLGLFAFAAVLLIIFYIFRAYGSFADSVVGAFSMPVRRILGSISSVFPFSVMEIIYCLLGIFAIFYIVYSVVSIVKSSRKIRRLLRRLFVLALIIIYIFTAYCYLWGIDYYGKTFSQKSGISADGVTLEALTAVTVYFLNGANEYAAEVSRDENGIFSEDMDSFFEESAGIYDNILSQFDFLDGTYHTPKKMIFSDIMSRLGFTGIYFAFTGESNINVASPGCLIPSTIAHELSHQLGITSEQEANFLGILACVSSDNTVYKYSGYLCGLIHLMNALYKADKDIWKAIRGTFSPELEADWVNNNEYWASMRSSVSDAAETVYNGYLKSNGQTMGILSYGACITLLVEYFDDFAK